VRLGVSARLCFWASRLRRHQLDLYDGSVGPHAHAHSLGLAASNAPAPNIHFSHSRISVRCRDWGGVECLHWQSARNRLSGHHSTLLSPLLACGMPTSCGTLRSLQEGPGATVPVDNATKHHKSTPSVHAGARGVGTLRSQRRLLVRWGAATCQTRVPATQHLYPHLALTSHATISHTI
jgi:hypothetical protein